MQTKWQEHKASDEWMTPPHIIKAARSVFRGTIDLDPASSPEANKIVKADKIYSLSDAAEDGATLPWHGNVWLNPPYSTGRIERFIDKLLQAKADAELDHWITLTNSATDTRWAQQLMAAAETICFVKGRIKFISPDGQPTGPGRHGSMICYGRSHPHYSRGAEFQTVFSKLGLVVWP